MYCTTPCSVADFSNIKVGFTEPAPEVNFIKFLVVSVVDISSKESGLVVPIPKLAPSSNKSS